MTFDFSTPQSHAINDGSSIISNSVIDGVLESARGLQYITIDCVYGFVLFINKALLLFEDTVNTPW